MDLRVGLEDEVGNWNFRTKKEGKGSCFWRCLNPEAFPRKEKAREVYPGEDEPIRE